MSRQFLPLSLPTLYIVPRLHILEHWGRGGVWRIPLLLLYIFTRSPTFFIPTHHKEKMKGIIFTMFIWGGLAAFFLSSPALRRGRGIVGLQDPGFCFPFLDLFFGGGGF